MDKEKIKYVIGFYFYGSYVALIKKNRPDWQTGLLNGIGGHIEDGENPLGAMTREFKEEAGIVAQWQYFCTMVFDNALIYCFKSFGSQEIKTMTDEKVDWFLHSNLPSNVIDNINWLVPLARYSDEHMRRLDLSPDILYTSPPEVAVESPQPLMTNVLEGLNKDYDEGWFKCREDMLKAGWRKVKEVKEAIKAQRQADQQEIADLKEAHRKEIEEIFKKIDILFLEYYAMPTEHRDSFTRAFRVLKNEYLDKAGK